MVIAGHETVAAALAWTLMLLAEHQPAQDRVRAELHAHAGPVSLLGHRETLPWTRAVVDEALRLYPPAWALSRRATSPTSSAVARSRPARWSSSAPGCCTAAPTCGPDPLGLPPRAVPRRAATAHPAYLPFGQGPRLCIGREFALGEMVLVLSRLLGRAPRRACHPAGRARRRRPRWPCTRAAGCRSW